MPKNKVRQTLEEILQSTSDTLFPADLGDKKVCVDSVGCSGDTPLHVMVRRQNSYAIEALIENGACINAVGDMGETPYAYIHSKVAVRDNESVWIGSGNWKSSSQPAPGNSGNRDWGVIVDDASLATLVRSHLVFDESSDRTHITAVTMADAPSGWTMPQSSPIVGNLSTPISGAFDATLLVCPDNCINELVQMLDSADDEILLSLQYLDMDWSYGWGENPIVSALEDAAQRGVKIRLILNGAYLDEDIQKVVDQMNEDWNATQGYDTNAVVMSAGDGVNKLHNKAQLLTKKPFWSRPSIGETPLWLETERWGYSSAAMTSLRFTLTHGMKTGSD